MIDRQALTHQLFEYLDTAPDMPDYLIGAPEMAETFDPYQMVGEWIALRQEVKQQNKLMQSAQQNFHPILSQIKALEQTAATPIKQEDDSGLVKDLLLVMDALDNAIAHSNSQIDSDNQINPLQPNPSLNEETGNGFWNQVFLFFKSEREEEETISSSPSSETLIDILISHKTGVEMIRRSLLDILKKRQVTPMNAIGQPFNTACMYAIAQQPSNASPPNTVVQEVVRGYWKNDRILREAQVIVSKSNE